MKTKLFCIEKATSELLPAGQENLVLNLDISDQIRSKKINAKDAMRSFKRRLAHKNPNVQLATISVSFRIIMYAKQIVLYTYFKNSLSIPVSRMVVSYLSRRLPLENSWMNLFLF